MGGILTTRSLRNSREQRYWSTASAASYNAVVLADSPAGFWELNETSGTVAADISGNGRDGVYVASPTLSINGVTLNGSSQCITFPSTAFDVIGNASQPYTMEIWVTTTSSSGNVAIFDKTQIATTADWNLLQMIAGGIPDFQLYDGTNNPEVKGGIINDGTEHILHAVREVVGGSPQIKLYADAMLIAMTTGLASIDCDNTRDLCIGARQAGTDRFFNGKVRKAAVYLSALTQAQISAHVAARSR